MRADEKLCGLVECNCVVRELSKCKCAS
jgi:hypothetical protein